MGALILTSIFTTYQNITHRLQSNEVLPAKIIIHKNDGTTSIVDPSNPSYQKNVEKLNKIINTSILIPKEEQVLIKLLVERVNFPRQMEQSDYIDVEPRRLLKVPGQESEYDLIRFVLSSEHKGIIFLHAVTPQEYWGAWSPLDRNLFWGLAEILGVPIPTLQTTSPVLRHRAINMECVKEGETAKANENTTCCEGLGLFQNYELDYGPFVDYEGKETYKQEPDCVVLDESVDNHHVCINCGNGACGTGENKCNCPQDCDVKGCVGEGSTLFPNDGNKCCAGLRAEGNYELQESGECKPIQGQLGQQLICVKCRDNICGKGENGCNCPQDCKNFKCKAHGEIPRYTAPGDDMSIQCCPGLKHRTQKEYFTENCQEPFIGGYTGICLSCGDGICDTKFEGKCNCPEDCK